MTEREIDDRVIGTMEQLTHTAVALCSTTEEITNITTTLYDVQLDCNSLLHRMDNRINTELTGRTYNRMWVSRHQKCHQENLDLTKTLILLYSIPCLGELVNTWED